MIDAQMRTTIDVDTHLLAEAKQRAALQHRSLSDVVNDALRTVFSDAPAQRTKTRIQLPVDGGSGLMPGVDLDDRHAILELLEAERSEQAPDDAAR